MTTFIRKTFLKTALSIWCIALLAMLMPRQAQCTQVITNKVADPGIVLTNESQLSRWEDKLSHWGMYDPYNDYLPELKTIMRYVNVPSNLAGIMKDMELRNKATLLTSAVTVAEIQEYFEYPKSMTAISKTCTLHHHESVSDMSKPNAPTQRVISEEVTLTCKEGNYNWENMDDDLKKRLAFNSSVLLESIFCETVGHDKENPFEGIMPTVFCDDLGYTHAVSVVRPEENQAEFFEQLVYAPLWNGTPVIISLRDTSSDEPYTHAVATALAYNEEKKAFYCYVSWGRNHLTNINGWYDLTDVVQFDFQTSGLSPTYRVENVVTLISPPVESENIGPCGENVVPVVGRVVDTLKRFDSLEGFTVSLGSESMKIKADGFFNFVVPAETTATLKVFDKNSSLVAQQVVTTGAFPSNENSPLEFEGAITSLVPSIQYISLAQEEVLSTIVFDANGGMGGKTVTLEVGTALTVPTVEREGYTFIEWSPAVPETTPATDTTYTAQWKANQYTVTFDADGGSGGKVITQDYGTKLTAPTVTRDGYTFVAWLPAVPETVPAKDTTYVAQWKKNAVTPTLYTITFDANGGVGGKAVTQAAGTTLAAPTVTREGYTFVKWEPSVPATTPAQNMTYTAQWKENVVTPTLYTITFNANGGTGGKTVTQAAGTTLTAPTVTREGYTFVKWEPSVPATTPAQNTTYTAQWEKVEDEGSEVQTISTQSHEFMWEGHLWSVSSRWAILKNGRRELLEATLFPRDKEPLIGHVKIPSETHCTADGHKDCIPSAITKIGNRAFAGQTQMTSVTIPESIQDLAVLSFSNTGLTYVEIPNSVRGVASSVFENCVSLESVKLPAYQTGNGFEGMGNVGSGIFDGGSMFKGCVNLKAVDVPINWTFIPASMFEECSSLKSVSLPDGIINIGSSAFKDCSSLTEIKLPIQLTTIGSGVFVGCSALRKGNVPKGVTETYTLGLIYGSVVAKNLTEVSVDFGAQILNDRFFTDGISLTKLTLPEGIKEVGDYCFGRYNSGGCEKLTHLKLPSTLTTIGRDAFENCKLLQSIELPDSVVTCGEGVFTDCLSLTSVTLPKTWKTISARTFDGCTSLVQISLPEGITEIGAYAFEDCNSLTEIQLPKGLLTIGSSAFYKCSSLEKINIPQGVTSRTVANVFPSAYQTITNITVDAGATILAESIFYGCKAVKNVSLPEGIAHLPKDAFNGCTSLETVKIPTSVTKIGNQAFSGCKGLTSIIIPAGVTEIETRAFTGCSSLKDVRFGGLPPATVGSSAFPSTNGYYQYEYSSAWEAIIKSDGTWNNLVMNVIDKPEVKQYTMTFNANGGVGGKTVTQNYGSALTAPKVTREGYTLTGWSPAVPKTVPAMNATYTAQWKVNQYKATFNANGGVGGKTVTQNYGSALAAPTVTREGYTFTGWSPAVPATVPATNTTYTAQWKVNQYTMTFNANGGVGGTVKTQNYGSALAAPKVTREGYTFTGWLPAVPKTIPAMNATYTAQWKKSSVDLSLLTMKDNFKKKQVTINGCTEPISGHLEIPEWIVRKDPKSGMDVQLMVVGIGNGAFQNQAKLEKVTLPNTITSIGKDAFKNCVSLDVNAIVMPNQSKLKVGKGAFMGCKVTAITAVPGEPKAGTNVAGYKVATSVSGFKLNAKLGTWTATFKKPGTYEAVLFKPGAALKAVRITVGAFPTVTIKTEGADAKCSVKGAGAYLMGKKVSLSAKASKEKIFLGFYDEKGVRLTNQTKYSFVMSNKNVTVTAKFTVEKITIDTTAITQAQWRVGQHYTILLPVDAESGVKTVKAKLPSGLKLTKMTDKWYVTGSPKKDGLYSASFTVNTQQKKSLTKFAVITVAMEDVKVGVDLLKNTTFQLGVQTIGIPITAHSPSGIKSVKASKLPAGMKVQNVNGQWIVTGTPKKAGTYYVTLTITTKAGSKWVQVVPVIVAAYPAWMAGYYEGPMTYSWYEAGSEAGDMLGYVIAEVNANGYVSVSAMLESEAYSIVHNVKAEVVNRTTNSITLRVPMHWYGPTGEYVATFTTDLVFEKRGEMVTLMYRSNYSVTDYMTGVLSRGTK